ncbi:MAG TPA: glycerol-3-phosphate 1-O-acyltransferase PlsY [Chitinophagales bacterium]|nr:glycerol-3-phosphate 1-O-acyltransferase PlsY [Chitinophagales bacterium]
MPVQIILACIGAYLIGAIPSSVWVGKIFYGKDVRLYGSGNAGATNTFRVLGAPAGIIVLAMDILKGILAVLLAYFFHRENFSASQFLYFQIGLGLAAGLGHIFPIYLNFTGGKGVATFFGVILWLFPLTALICIMSFFIVFIITHYVSLSSMVASVAFTVSLFLLYPKNMHERTLIIFGVLIPIIIFYTHRKNIQRLLKGAETKMYFSKKENPS